jgi:hypothetical protein
MRQGPEETDTDEMMTHSWAGAPGRLAVAAALIITLAAVGCGGGENSTSATPTAINVEQSPTTTPVPVLTTTSAPAASETPSATTETGCLPSAAGIGGTLQTQISEGPFTFQIGIFDDPRFALPQVGLMPADTSGVPGVGWFHKWSYQGPDIGPVVDMWGVVVQGDFGTYQSGGTIAVLKSGQQPEVTGGIVPVELEPGQRIELAVRVEISGQSYGAIMSLDIEASGGTLIVCNPTFRPWPSSPAGTASPQ